MKMIERYDIFERVMGEGAGNQFQSNEIKAHFYQDGRVILIEGFRCGDDARRIRFMPDSLGKWTYEIIDKVSEETIETGEFECVKESGQNHGPVKVKAMTFCYADDSCFVPIGTTLYAWIYQTDQLIHSTLQTLANSPFNKVRMCLFPKSMEYNQEDPKMFPFFQTEEGTWAIDRPNEDFWAHLEKQLNALLSLGIEADIILFHPYDRWGFSSLTREDSLNYVDYCIRRLSAFRNVWWSLANEYELIFSKTDDDWEELGNYLSANDPYRHLLSNHNWLKPYDATKPFITHHSIQTTQYEKTKHYRDVANKPVIIDEFGYEGDIAYKWGNLSGFEFIHRCWSIMVLGGYFTHGETFHREDEILWWSKGGTLHGESKDRIAFLKTIMEEADGEIVPEQSEFADPNDHTITIEASDEGAVDNPYVKVVQSLGPDELYHLMASVQPFSGHQGEVFKIHYLGRECRAYYDVDFPQDGYVYTVEIVDIWEMTRTMALTNGLGTHRIQLPGKEGIALIIKRVVDLT